jgi:putative hydrolase of HD superfamily
MKRMTENKQKDIEKIFVFLQSIEKLKTTLRYNQTTSGRKESSAEHSWRLAVTAMITAQELRLDINSDHAIKIALVHDLAEAITGDIDAIQVAEGKFSKADKKQGEQAAIAQLMSALPPTTAKEIGNLWHEYDQCTTREAKFIKALDKIETLTQLVESGYKTYDKPEFIPNYADRAVKEFPELLPMLKILKHKLKQEFSKGNIPWKKEYDSLD